MNPTSSSRARLLVAEFLVIVVGVLVALAVDQFMAERDDRRAELDYAARLRADLASDAVRFAWFRSVLGTKAEVLQQLQSRDPRLLSVEDPPAAMARLTYSTFEELQNSGSLRLVTDSELRSQLTRYYASYGRMTDILVERFGSHRELAFATLPGQLQYRARSDSLAVDAGQLRAGLTALTSHSGLEGAVNAELAYTAALLFYLDEFADQASDLLAALSAHYPD